MNERGISEIVRTTILNHSHECIFTANAVESVVAKFKASDYPDDFYSFGVVDLLTELIAQEEIYCPHEGIDRRAEYYAKINLAAWSEWASIAHEMV